MSYTFARHDGGGVKMVISDGKGCVGEPRVAVVREAKAVIVDVALADSIVCGVVALAAATVASLTIVRRGVIAASRGSGTNSTITMQAHLRVDCVAKQTGSCPSNICSLAETQQARSPNDLYTLSARN
jgi:hypothetical protein